MPPLRGIVNYDLPVDEDCTLYSPILDSYDHWTQIDNRLKGHAEEVFIHPQAIGGGVLHMSVFAHYILSAVESIRSDRACAQELADLEAFVRSFLTSSRSLCDEIAAFISKTCLEKKGQAPLTLRKLISWTEKNKHRAKYSELESLFLRIDWFEQLRQTRDALMHFGGDPWIITNGQDFRLIVYATHKNELIIDTDLLRFLSNITSGAISFMDKAGVLINSGLSLPADRQHSRKLLGLRLARLKMLKEGWSPRK